jgi:hypothetical protein
MEPCESLDRFKRRKIEQALVADMQSAREFVRRAKTEEEKRAAAEALDRAVQRFKDFVTRQVIPEEIR